MGGTLSAILPYLKNLLSGGGSPGNPQLPSGMGQPPPASAWGPSPATGYSSPQLPQGMGIAPTPDPSQQITDVTGAGAGPMATAPNGTGLIAPNAIPAGQQIANLTGAEAGPDAVGPSAAPTAPAAPQMNNLAAYANVMKALQGLTASPERPRIGGGAPHAGAGPAGTPVTPGPRGPTSPSAVGAAYASPQGQQLIQRLRALMQSGGGMGMSPTGA